MSLSFNDITEHTADTTFTIENSWKNYHNKR